MDADQPGVVRWVLAILITAAIIGLVVLARGEPDHGPVMVALTAGRLS
jgi:hypothetical protein